MRCAVAVGSGGSDWWPQRSWLDEACDWRVASQGVVSNTVSSSLTVRFLLQTFYGLVQSRRAVQREQDEDGRNWREPKHISRPHQVTGTGKWAGRIPGGSSPRVHGNDPASALNQSSRGVLWHHREGSVVEWDGAEWSRRERGHGGGAVGEERTGGVRTCTNSSLWFVYLVRLPLECLGYLDV